MDPLLDFGYGLGAVFSKSSFASAESDGKGFPHITKIEDLPISFADIDCSQYQDVLNDTDHAEFSGLRSSNAFRCHKRGHLPTNANIMTENGPKVGKLMTVGM